MRKLSLALIALLLPSAFALRCVAEVEGTGHTGIGTCINTQITNIKGEVFWRACNWRYSHLANGGLGDPWIGYELCYATINTGGELTNSSRVVAEAWSVNPSKLIACENYNGAYCDINPDNGFGQTSETGVCDASDKNCVTCNADRTESNAWNGGYSFTGAGDGLCESGCGASIQCDEMAKGYYTANRGCNLTCSWLNCGPYSWDPSAGTCYGSCTSMPHSLECYNPEKGVCAGGVCVYDNLAPSYSDLGSIDDTPTPDNTLIVGDNITFHAYWADDYYLDNATLQLRLPAGNWFDAQTINLLGSSAWTNFTINTTAYADLDVEWMIKCVDSVGNEALTPIGVFHPFSASAEIRVTLHESDSSTIEELFEFSAAGQQVFDKKADDSMATMGLGDFDVDHIGIGTLISLSFKLNQTMNSGLHVKINNVNNPLTAFYLTTSNQSFSFCNNMLPGDKCRLWLWLDVDQGVDPALYQNKIGITSVSI